MTLCLILTLSLEKVSETGADLQRPKETAAKIITLSSPAKVVNSIMICDNSTGIYILAISPPPGGGEKFLSNMKNREEFEGGLHEKRKGKGGKRRKKKKGKKVKRGWRETKKWIRV